MAVPPPLASQSPSRRGALKRRLEHLYRTFDRGFLETDPLAFVHRYPRADDREVVGFLASTLAFGNVRAIGGSLTTLLTVMGPSPSGFVDHFDAGRDGGMLDGTYHRWIRPADLVALLAVLRRMREGSGSIGAFFAEGYGSADADVGPALASFSERARALAGPSDRRRTADRAGSPTSLALRPAAGEGNSVRLSRSGRREGTVAPFFASPRDGSACKRLNLYLRWMVRDGDGLDLGLWKGISRRQLVLPLDTHLVRLSRALGLTRRRSPGWRMAVEATRSLALLDPDDPVKYDFSLSRLGILDLCLHGRDTLACRTCEPRVATKRRIRGRGPRA